MIDEDALCIEIPVIIKARDDRRVVEVEASSQHCDGEGDVILQKALLDSADTFVKTGALDIEHLSEIGHRLGIRCPADYIVGIPLEVKDIGAGRTSVVGQLYKGREQADSLWSAITAEPPVRYRASIYGFPKPGEVIDARVAKGDDLHGASRYLVRGIDWRSLAFTRNPVNDSLRMSAHVVTAKSMIAIMKSRLAPGIEGVSTSEPASYAPMTADFILPPRNREELMGHHHYHIVKGRCPHAGGDIGNSVYGFREHFMKCCGLPHHEADMRALALMHLLKRERSAATLG